MPLLGSKDRVEDADDFAANVELAAALARTAPQVRFEWLLPGHGDRKHLPADEFAHRMHNLAGRTGELSPQPIDFTALRW